MEGQIGVARAEEEVEVGTFFHHLKTVPSHAGPLHHMDNYATAPNPRQYAKCLTAGKNVSTDA